MLSFGAAVIDVLHRQVQLVLMMFALPGVLRAAISRHAQQRDRMLLEKGRHPVIQQVGRHQRVLAVIELGEGYCRATSDEAWLPISYTLQRMT